MTRRLSTQKFGENNVLQYAVRWYFEIAEENFVCFYYYIPSPSVDSVIDVSGNEEILAYMKFTDEVTAHVVQKHNEGGMLWESPSDILFRLVREAEGNKVPGFLEKMVLGS